MVLKQVSRGCSRPWLAAAELVRSARIRTCEASVFSSDRLQPAPAQRARRQPSRSSIVSHLFEPLIIGTLRLSNRIVIAPMCQYSAEEGCATDWHMIHLGHLALSGAGLLIVEATAVSPEGRISPQDLGLYCDANEDALARVLQFVRAHSPIRMAIQISHAGRKASGRAPWEGGAQLHPHEPGGWKTLAP